MTDEVVGNFAGHTRSATLQVIKNSLALTKANVGLGNVDNTADSAKPISAAAQAALSAIAVSLGQKAESLHQHEVEAITGLTAFILDAFRTYLQSGQNTTITEVGGVFVIDSTGGGAISPDALTDNTGAALLAG